MSGQHYVSKFHLSAFCDPAGVSSPDPWVWLGATADESVRRRSPKNVGTVPSLFDGPGGFADPETSLETFLANDVEGPAAKALRRLLQTASITQLPPEVMRYLAWAGGLTVLAHAESRGELGHAASPDAEWPDGGAPTARVG